MSLHKLYSSFVSHFTVDLMVIFSVVSGACKSILIILISNLLTSWFLGALSVFHILTFEMNFCPCTRAFMSHALIGRWTHSTSLRSLLWVHARKANTFTWLTFKWTQLQSCTETQSVKDPHLSWAYTWSAVPVSPASVLGAGAAAACGTKLKEAAAVFGRRRAGEEEQSPICGEAAVSSARRGGRSESEQEELQPVWSQREGGSSDNRAALPRVVNTFKEAWVWRGPQHPNTRTRCWGGSWTFTASMQSFHGLIPHFATLTNTQTLFWKTGTHDLKACFLYPPRQ